MPKQIGFKRLLLSRTQKYLLDMSRLGTGFQPNRAERIVQFLENLSIGYAVRHLYWHLMPKRKYAPYGTKAEIKEYLPWFSDDPDGNSYTYLQKSPTGALLRREEFNSQLQYLMDYSYSWKKAHELACKRLHEVQQAQHQQKLDGLLRQQKERGE